MYEVEGKAAVVTGAASGIGLDEAVAELRSNGRVAMGVRSFLPLLEKRGDGHISTT